MPLSCPKQEFLLEWVSIPDEMPKLKQLRIRSHSMFCSKCRERISTLRGQWESYFTPAPDVTSSLISIYGRLQKDETLILKGWKLNDLRTRPSVGGRLRKERWLLQGGVIAFGGLATLFFVFGGSKQLKPTPNPWLDVKVPLAQIRYEDKNRVKVQYVQPELLQSIEFETSTR